MEALRVVSLFSGIEGFGLGFQRAGAEVVAHVEIDKECQRMNMLFSQDNSMDECFKPVFKFKHLGLEFKADGLIGLSRDKTRKICNIFKYALRRKKGSSP